MQSCPVNQIEQQDRHERKSKHSKVGIDIPQIWHGHIAIIGNLGDLGKYLLIGQTEKYCTHQETEQTRDKVIKFSFAGPGDTSTWSVPHQSHPHTEQQPACQVADDVGGGDIGESNDSKPSQDE
jgi:hypothetical protein